MVELITLLSHFFAHFSAIIHNYFAILPFVTVMYNLQLFLYNCLQSVWYKIPAVCYYSSDTIKEGDSGLFQTACSQQEFCTCIKVEKA